MSSNQNNEYASFDSNTPNADDFADLAALDNAWESTEVSEEDLSSEPPDGIYQVVVVKAQLGRGKDKKDENGSTRPGTPYLNMHLKITGPTHVGRFIFKKMYLTAGTTKMVVTDLFKCGLRCKPSDLGERAIELIGLRLKVKKANRNDPQYPDSSDTNILSKLGKLSDEEIKDLQSQKNGKTASAPKEEDGDAPF